MHLDVKPSNIVMGGPPRLIDLSVARTVAEAAALRAPIGTDAFMAPEQCAPDGRLGPPADVFGLAATLYTGAHRRAPVPALRRALAAADARPRPRSPAAPRAALADVLLAGLDANPTARPTAREFATALEPLVAALPRRMTLGRRA